MSRVTLLLALLSLPLVAQAQCPGVTTQLTPFASEHLTVGATVKTFTASVYKPPGITPSMAVVSVEQGTILYQVVGTPTPTVGHPVMPPATFTICGIDSIAAFKAIRVSTDALLTVTYYRSK